MIQTIAQSKVTLLTSWLGGNPNLWINLLVGIVGSSLAYLCSRYWPYGLVLVALMLLSISVPGARNSSDEATIASSNYGVGETAISYVFTGLSGILTILGGLKYMEKLRQKRSEL
jgi:hypothetical protein